MAMNKKHRLVLGLCGLLVAILGVFLTFKPAQAANTGGMEGGVFVVSLYGYDMPMSSNDTAVSLTPNPPGANIKFTNGHLTITGLPAGNYILKLTYTFKPAYVCTPANQAAHAEI